MQSFRIRQIFYSRLTAEELKASRKLIGVLARIWGDEAKGLCERLRGDFDRAKNQLETILNTPIPDYTTPSKKWFRRD